MNETDLDTNEIDIEYIKVDITIDEDESGEVMCEECSKVIERKKLMKHKELWHKEFICSECGIAVVGKEKLRNHIKSHKKATCEVCKKEFQLKNLPSHIKSCSKKASRGKKQHRCQSCGYLAQSSCFPSNFYSLLFIFLIELLN